MNSAGSRDRLMVILAIITLYVFWGGTYLAIHFALISLQPFMMGAVRFLTAGSLMYLFLRITGTPRPNRAQWGSAAIVGFLLLICGNGGVMVAQSLGISSGLAALGVAAVPIWASFFAMLWKQWPSRLEWLGVVVGLLGVGLLNADGGFQASIPGAIVVTLGGICWAFGSIWSRYLPLPQGPISTSMQMLVGGLCFAIASLVSGEQLSGPPTTESIFGMIYLIFFGGIIGYTAYGYLLRRVRPALATSYSYVNPVIAVLLGVSFAGEEISAAGIIAMVIIVLGVALVIVARDQPKPAQAEASQERETPKAEALPPRA